MQGNVASLICHVSMNLVAARPELSMELSHQNSGAAPASLPRDQTPASNRATKIGAVSGSAWQKETVQGRLLRPSSTAHRNIRWFSPTHRAAAPEVPKRATL